MPVELVWGGKYDAEGRKHSPLRIALPFQTVETVNESVQERQRGLEALFSSGRDSEWRNRLIWGDKKYVLPSLLPEFGGKVDLIYIDPPFATGDDFSFQVQVDGQEFLKEPSVIEQKAYRDTWGSGLDSYMKWFYETVILLRELLSPTGSLYVHLDYHVAHYAKIVLDEIFGSDNFLSELVWKRTSARSDAVSWGNIHDTLFFYSKSNKYTWNLIYQSHDEAYVKSKYANRDERGIYQNDNLTAAGTRSGDSGKPWRGIDPAKIGGHWKVNREAVESLVTKERAAAMSTQEKLELLDANDFIYWPAKGRSGGTGVPRFKRYLKEDVALQDLILDIPPVNSQAQERVGYATQKPGALLDRIISASSNEGDLILDCFCGSGTTAAVAEKLSRHWIVCDLGRFAIHATRKRLLSIPDVKPFVLQNLGKYERQAWQAGEFGVNDAERVAAYTNFILDLYQAQHLTGFTWLHGIKAGRAVHVGAVDSPVTVSDVKSIIIEWRKNLGKNGTKNAAIDVLGWEFALDMNETAKQQASEAGVELHFLVIPREVLEKKAVEQGDIHFFELAALFVETQVKRCQLTLKLTNFIAPLEYIPQEIREKIRKWESWIDYWAIDFDFKGDTFHNQWQSYRMRKNKSIETTTIHTYEQAGTYMVQVKVIDILGNDTTRTLRVDVA